MKIITYFKTRCAGKGCVTTVANRRMQGGGELGRQEGRVFGTTQVPAQSCSHSHQWTGKECQGMSRGDRWGAPEDTRASSCSMMAG